MQFRIDIARDGYVSRENTEDGPVESWVEVFTILAHSERGDVWALGDEGGSIVGSEDEATVREVLGRIDHTPDTRPELWSPCDPIYGSEAWDDDAERSLACFEADCYGEPRPRW
jgi:hypothetical protein